VPQWLKNIRKVVRMNYRAEFEDDNMEVLTARTNEEATEQAFELEKEHGTLFNVTLLDDNYNDVETIF
jgi:hypothetical protein